MNQEAQYDRHPDFCNHVSFCGGGGDEVVTVELLHIDCMEYEKAQKHNQRNLI